MKVAWIAALLTAVNLTAGTYTYTFIPTKGPPRPRGYPPRVYPTGQMVWDEAFVSTGVLLPGEQTSFSFRYPLSSGGQSYNSFDGGSLAVDPVTGSILSGQLHTTCAWSTYGYSAEVWSGGLHQDNPNGGNALGTWTVSYVP